MNTFKVRKALQSYLSCSGTIRRGLYSLSLEATQLYEEAYEKIASAMGFAKEEIFFVSSPKDVPLEILEGPFDTLPEGILDISSLLHRKIYFEKAYLKGRHFNIGLDVVAMRKEYLEKMEPFEYGGSMILDVENLIFEELPYKFAAGTQDIASIIALGEALSFNVSNKVDEIAEAFRAELCKRELYHKYFKLSSAFEFNGLHYVPLDNPEEIFRLLK